MKRSNYLQLRDDKCDCCICTDDIKFIEVRSMDEKPSVKGLYILYKDDTGTFIADDDIQYQINKGPYALYEQLVSYLTTVV